jgi:hypothetical protein
MDLVVGLEHGTARLAGPTTFRPFYGSFGVFGFALLTAATPPGRGATRLQQLHKG